MNSEFYITLTDLIEELSCNIAYMPVEPSTVKISSKNINRLGLQLIGSTKKFDNTTILTMGESESHFFSTLTSEETYNSLKAILSFRPPVLIITTGIKPIKEILKVAKEYKIPILTSEDSAPEVTSNLTPFLNLNLASRITRSGGLINVHGEGILLIGESGIGKSETAIELLKRGHRLIADDLVEIRKIRKNTLIGSAPKNIRHFIEVRGIGIINAKDIFGIGAIKLSEKIDIVINLGFWNDKKKYDRIGEEMSYTEILGVKIPYIDIPIRPGRNIAMLVEIAAINYRQRKLGQNAAKQLLKNLGIPYPKTENETMKKCIWDI